ncbi:MAG: lipopolysaccharide heptosyltransferase II [Candidatus Berkiellales bacterium]
MVNKTLIIGPSWVGDMMMAQALFKAIKAQHPDTTIDVLAPEWSRPLTERMPEVNQSIAMPLKHGELNLKTRYELGKKLKNNHYQRCYVCPNSFKSALIPFWADIPERIGWRGEWRYILLNRVKVLNKQQYPLMVQRYVALAYEHNQPLPDPLFRPHLVVKSENVEAALKRYELSVGHSPVLVLCPGAEFGPSKRWPEQNYAELANHYLNQGWQVWILGSAKDSEVVKVIQELTQNRSKDLTGHTTLAEAIDLMSQANLVVTNDSGLMHIAAALERPLVAVYGSTDPGFTPPLNDQVRIVRENIACSPCFKRVCPLQHHQCMKLLSPQKVIQAAQSLVTQ